MSSKIIKEKIIKIVTESVESQMDWDAYYSGEDEESVEEIMEIISKSIKEDRQNLIKQVEGMKMSMDELAMNILKYSAGTTHGHNDYNQAITDIIKLIEGL